MSQATQFSSIGPFFKRLKGANAFLIIAAIGLAVFANSLGNQFVSDDLVYIIDNPQIHVVNLPASFLPDELFNADGQYRPIPALYFSVAYALFGKTPYMYHFLQILLHVAVASLTYVLLRKYLRPGLALAAAVVSWSIL